MSTCRFALVLVLSIGIRFGETLECYNCSNVPTSNICNTTTHCKNGESCFSELTNNAHIFGCIENQHCGSLSSAVIAVVGRTLHDDNGNPLHTMHHISGQDRTQRDVEHCFECCSTDVCNIHLCQHLKPTTCIDDAKVDCAWMNSKFNICQNVHEAKTVCPKFCGFCTLVDGNWDGWSAWSACDVTCESGIQFRTRHCTNPTPVSGGLDCQGSAKETKVCSFAPCPVTPTVAFQSHALVDTSLGSNQVLVFKTTTLNIGNGYSNITGKFTAPLPGTYSFSTQLCLPMSSSSYIYYAIVQNDTNIQMGQFHGDRYAIQCHSAEITTVLKTNESVWITSNEGYGSLEERSNMWNSFAGHLVHI